MKKSMKKLYYSFVALIVIILAVEFCIFEKEILQKIADKFEM